MKYKIERYPKNKDENYSELSIHQKEVRKKEKIYKYSKTKTCKKCGKELPLSEFYLKDKETGRLSNGCRDCQLKQMGVIEIGKQRFADKILIKGFKRCGMCKRILPLNEFWKKEYGYNLGGKSSHCKKCAYKTHRKWIYRQPKKTLSVKHNVDGFEFTTDSEFAEYIEYIYGIKKKTTQKRIYKGWDDEKCKMSVFESKSINANKKWAKIKK